jgi:hypothetical protein
LTIVCNKKYILAKSVAGSFVVMPRYIYDPKNLMDAISIKDINEKFAELSENPVMKEFATEYNSEKFQRDSGYIVGSGSLRFRPMGYRSKNCIEEKEKLVGREV